MVKGHKGKGGKGERAQVKGCKGERVQDIGRAALYMSAATLKTSAWVQDIGMKAQDMDERHDYKGTRHAYKG